MSTPLNLKIDPEKVQEISMVDLAFMILKAANTPYYYRDLMTEVAKLRGMNEAEIDEAIAQLYTEINIDGRFACVGTNLWGLKRWYPIERSEDPIGNSKRPRIINDEDDDLEDDDFVEEDNYSSGDEEDYDALNDDSEDELFSEDDEEDVEEEEELLGDEEIDEDDEDKDELEDEDSFDENEED